MYGCDCDGVKRDSVDGGGVEGAAVRSTLKVIQSLTGHRPPTCPWRAFYEPIVREVLDVAWAIEGGNLPAALGPDPDYIVMQGVSVYRRALLSTKADDMKLDQEERERKREAATAARKAGFRG